MHQNQTNLNVIALLGVLDVVPKPVLEVQIADIPSHITYKVCDICENRSLYLNKKSAMLAAIGRTHELVPEPDGIGCVFICSTCLDAGLKGAIARARENADVLRKKADDYEKLAKYLEEMPPDNWVAARELFREINKSSKG